MAERERCPKGKVQVNFVGCDPATRQGEYGWKPCDSTFLEIAIDGETWRIDVGNYESARGGERRGLHIIGPMNMEVDKHSVNALDIFIKPR